MIRLRCVGLDAVSHAVVPAYVAMDLCSGGTLQSWIKDGNITDRLMVEFTCDLIDAMLYLHQDKKVLDVEANQSRSSHNEVAQAVLQSKRDRASSSQYEIAQARKHDKRDSIDELDDARNDDDDDEGLQTSGSLFTFGTANPMQRALSGGVGLGRDGPKVSTAVQANIDKGKLQMQQLEAKAFGLGWTERLSADGEVYFYNVRTHKHTSNIADVLDRSHLSLAEQRRQAKIDQVVAARKRAAKKERKMAKQRKRKPARRPRMEL